MKRNLTRLGLRKMVLVSCSLCLSLFCFAQQNVSYYFQAHADDWQLFMSSNAWDDAGIGAKVVFVIPLLPGRQNMAPAMWETRVREQFLII